MMENEIDWNKVERWSKSDGTIRVGSDGQPLFGDEIDPNDMKAEVERLKARCSELNGDYLVAEKCVDSLMNDNKRLQDENETLRRKLEIETNVTRINTMQILFLSGEEPTAERVEEAMEQQRKTCNP